VRANSGACAVGREPTKSLSGRVIAAALKTPSKISLLLRSMAWMLEASAAAPLARALHYSYRELMITKSTSASPNIRSLSLSLSGVMT
jgi:hypothetical protein